MRSRIESWCVWMLSQGGKEVFIKSVLQVILTFTMSCFLLPVIFCADLEKIIKRFYGNDKGAGVCISVIGILCVS